MPRSKRLLSHLPPGTKYVLESHGPWVHRYVEFPDGHRVRLPVRKAQVCTCAAETTLVPAHESVTETPQRPISVRRRVTAEI